MSDRELLEAAAKAAGIDTSRWTDINGGGFWVYPGIGARVWNPLTDDGDALRLAVRIGLQVLCPDAEPTAVVRWWPWDNAHRIEESAYSNQEAATRRAIVRAAASIASRGGEAKS